VLITQPEANYINHYLAAMWQMSKQCHCPSKRGKSVTDAERNSFFVLIPTTRAPSGLKKASSPVPALVSRLHKHHHPLCITDGQVHALTKPYSLSVSPFLLTCLCNQLSNPSNSFTGDLAIFLSTFHTPFKFEFVFKVPKAQPCSITVL